MSPRVKHNLFAHGARSMYPSPEQPSDQAKERQPLVRRVAAECEETQFARQLAFCAAQPVKAVAEGQNKEQRHEQSWSWGKPEADEPVYELETSVDEAEQQSGQDRDV
ncbi:MAG TPA: hypothetical protein VFC26_06985, partial [Verrucomicrobiae bacterium]|nr:hypothetical protein [Verrucomicrobiae bacterium]